ncbi:MAG: RNA polymerase sigma factor [Pseudonocardiaceae bacterium]
MTDDEVDRYIDELARELWAKLRRFAEGLGSRDAEAAVGDAFEALTRFLMKRVSIGATPVLSIDHPSAWLRVVVSRNVWKQHRKNSVMRGAVQRIEEDPNNSRAAPSAEDKAIQAEIVRKVRESLGQLSPSQRDVVELVLLGYTLKEIAEMLDKPVGTIKTHAFRAYKKLRRILGELK